MNTDIAKHIEIQHAPQIRIKGIKERSLFS